jgi:hypothetical protein
MTFVNESLKHLPATEQNIYWMDRVRESLNRYKHISTGVGISYA